MENQLQGNQYAAPVQGQSAPQGPETEQPQQVVISPEEYQRMQQAAVERDNVQNQLQMVQGQMNAQRAQEAYEREKAKVMDEGDPAKIEAFYEERSRHKDAEVQRALIPVLAEGFRKKVADDFGLTPQQASMLGEDPNRFNERAGYFAGLNAQSANREQVTEQSQLAFQAQQRGLQNFDRIGGMQGSGAPVEPDFEKGSLEHLAYRMYGDGQTFVGGSD